MTTTQDASTAPPVSRTVFVEALHRVARIVEQGAPAPLGIVGDVGGEVVVHVRAEDLSAWVILLDLPAPDWRAASIHDEGVWITLEAYWPEAVVIEHLFRIESTRREATIFEPYVGVTY